MTEVARVTARFPRERAKREQGAVRCVFAVLAGLMLMAAVFAVPAAAQRGTATERAFAASLEPGERRVFEVYTAARAFYNLTLDEYWSEVSDRRAGRRKKRAAGEAFTKDDYVSRFPPEFTGKPLPAALAKRWAAFQADQDKAPGREPEKPKPDVSDFLAHAKSQYGFVPDRIAEREFKLRYAREALSLGLTKDQVVRVYALETSGLGVADMIAGVHPITRKGKPISTALGYAQLLAANSTSELVKHGPGFVARLKEKARRAGSQAASERYERKARVVARMLADAKSIPNTWDRHLAFARTAKGMGIHALNIDGDVGPWLQVLKLEGLKKTAESRGRPRLTGAEIELMNLAGPMTGLEMMQPVSKAAPTTNFFERAAYGRNTIVRGKTAAELLTALDERMNINIKNEGAIEFSAAFDQAAAELASSR